VKAAPTADRPEAGGERVALDEQIKDVAPSTGLCKWFDHDPVRWTEFQSRYRAELGEQSAALERIRALAGARVVALVYSARDEEHNDAVGAEGDAARRRLSGASLT
jgi:uncharacterized protein YeaO (DUF488 family)